jgi:hypothetical protein
MEKFGKFIDDIRKEFKWLTISFEEVPFGEALVITTPYSTKKYIVNTNNIGKINYDSEMYHELLDLTITSLNNMKNNSNKI